MKKLGEADTFGERQPDTLVPFSDITGLGFRKVGEFSLTPCKAKLTCSLPSRGANKEPATYIIAIIKGEAEAAVLYVGRGSDGWRKRRGMHIGNRKRRFHTRIIDDLLQERVVTVFERVSGVQQHFDCFVSTAHTEEAALMARFRPVLNNPRDVNRAVAFHARHQKDAEAGAAAKPAR